MNADIYWPPIDHIDQYKPGFMLVYIFITIWSLINMDINQVINNDCIMIAHCLIIMMNISRPRKDKKRDRSRDRDRDRDREKDRDGKKKRHKDKEKERDRDDKHKETKSKDMKVVRNYDEEEKLLENSNSESEEKPAKSSVVATDSNLQTVDMDMSD